MISPGARLGQYEILSALGAGGMGEVYRARDTKLDRDVAIKVLPELFVSDPERVARFQREAKTLAALNHPHIGGIYGLEDAGGVRALVLELVEGPTLADRIAQGPIPLDEALPIAKQIAEALEAAHEAGIIHRDLKPANIKLRPDGTVKVLDFGLAKALEPVSGGSASVTASPTITTPAMMTGIGMILGTAAYMSPEQAKGRAADKRSDVWAFGCVLYEMLTGKRAFAGDDVSDTLAAVLRAEPDWSAIPSEASASIRRLVQGCLNRDRNERVRDMSTALFLLKEPAIVSALPTVVVSPRKPVWKKAAPTVAAAISFGILGIVATWTFRSAPPGSVTRFAIMLPDGQRFPNARPVAISPDGSRIAYVSLLTDPSDGQSSSLQIFLRSLTSLDAVPLGKPVRGPSSIFAPVFSPGGEWVAYWTAEDSTLKKMHVNGGTVLPICKADRPGGVMWSGHDVMFAEQNKGIMKVSAEGGEPAVLVAVTPPETAISPQLIDGGRSLLFSLARGDEPNRWDEGVVVVQSLSSGQRKVVLRGGSDARYLPTGHLVYAVGTTLFAVSFDEKTGDVRGAPTPIIEGLRRSVVGGAGGSVAGPAHFAFSSDGTLVYVPGTLPTDNPSSRKLALVDLNGSAHPLPLPAQAFLHPHVSPNGKHLVFETDDGKEATIWVVDDLQRPSARRLTLEGRNVEPIWTPDSQFVVFQSDRDGDRGLFRQRADGSQPAERLTKAERGTRHSPDSVSPDGRTLAFHSFNTVNVPSIWTLSLERDRKLSPFSDPGAKLPAMSAAFSPDGRWLAYTEILVPGGPPNLFVQPFPATGARYRLTTRVGNLPVWSPDGTKILYEVGVSGPNQGSLMMTDFRVTPSVSVGAPTVITVPPRPRGLGMAERFYDVTPDGKQIIMVIAGQDKVDQPSPATQINVVMNWFEELKARVPTK